MEGSLSRASRRRPSPPSVMPAELSSTFRTRKSAPNEIEVDDGRGVECQTGERIATPEGKMKCSSFSSSSCATGSASSASEVEDSSSPDILSGRPSVYMAPTETSGSLSPSPSSRLSETILIGSTSSSNHCQASAASSTSPSSCTRTQPLGTVPGSPRTKRGRSLRLSASTTDSSSEFSEDDFSLVDSRLKRKGKGKRARKEMGSAAPSWSSSQARPESPRVVEESRDGSKEGSQFRRRSRAASVAPRSPSASSWSAIGSSEPSPLPPPTRLSSLVVLDMSPSASREVIDVDEPDDDLVMQVPARRARDGGETTGTERRARTGRAHVGVDDLTTLPRRRRSLRDGGNAEVVNPVGSSSSRSAAFDEVEVASGTSASMERRRRLFGRTNTTNAGSGAAARRARIESSGERSDASSLHSNRQQQTERVRGQHLAARLQREESIRLVQSDAELARQLQSQEPHFSGSSSSAESAAMAMVAAALAGRPAASSAEEVNRRPGIAAGQGRAGGRGAHRFHSNGRGRVGRGSGVDGGAHASAADGRRRRQQSSANSRRATQRVREEIAQIMHEALANLPVPVMGTVGAGSVASLAMMSRELTPADYQSLLSLDEENNSNSKKGLSQEELSMLPQQTGNGTGALQQCCICMDDMTPTQSITRLPACLHTFHSKCISQWLEGQATCPIDKVVVSVHNQ